MTKGLENKLWGHVQLSQELSWTIRLTQNNLNMIFKNYFLITYFLNFFFLK